MRSLSLLLLLAGCNNDGDPSDGTVAYGDACDASAECSQGLLCAGNGTCLSFGEPGTAQMNDECVSTSYCETGLVCASTGVCTTSGDPGTGARGDACNDVDDCSLGLFCEGICSGLEVPLWPGVACEQPAADNRAFRVFYEVDEQRSEFYRLPFPNNTYLVDGRPNLQRHPTPGELVPRIGDPVADLMTSLGQQSGFGNNQAVFFRFSDRVSFETLERGLPGEGSVGVIDLTQGATYGELHLTGLASSTAASQYICHNRIAITPVDGRPYLPGHTYAAFVGASARAEGGDVIEPDADFVDAFSADAPSDDALGNAHTSLQPFRQWLDDTGVAQSEIVAATVFTVQDPVRDMQRLRDAVHSAALGVPLDVHVCGDSPGPFGTADGRGCTVRDGVVEVQGTLDLPSFQAGLAPYKTVSDGGGIDVSGDTIEPNQSATVVFSLTLPEGPMPVDGWPLAIYAHDIGGSYQSAVVDGVSDSLATLQLDDGTRTPIATLTWDAPLHGPRNNADVWDTTWLELDAHAYAAQVLFDNPLNPSAQRGNRLQAASDVLAVIRAASEWNWSSAVSPVGAEVRFDTSNLFFVGHGMGASVGVAALAVEPGVKAAVFAQGSGLQLARVLGQTSPRSPLPHQRVSLADASLNREHPVLNLWQANLDTVDAVNLAAYQFGGSVLDREPRHVFQVYGVGDTYAVDASQTALARALRVQQVAGQSPPLAGITELSAPVVDNRFGGEITGVVALYAAVGNADAHFVLFDSATAQRQAAHFLGTHVRDGVPTVVEP